MSRFVHTLFCVLLLASTAGAQTVGFSISHRGADSARIENFSLGLATRADTLLGAQLNTSLNTSHFVRGVQLAGITNIAGQFRGMQLGGFANITTAPFKGFQLSGITNIASGVEHGLQWAGVLNVSADYMRGTQLAIYNYADSLNGTQLGLINVARTHPKGWQVGLVNYTRDTTAHKIGLVNVNPQTTVDFLVYPGTSTKVNGAVRFRNRSTYNIVGAGTHYMGLDEKFSGSAFYRIGQYFDLSPRWSLSGDVGYFHIETFEQHSQTKPERLYSLQARLNLDYRLNRRMGAFASVGYGDTRYYSHHRHYRSRPIFEAGLSFRYQRNVNSQSIASQAGRKGGDRPHGDDDAASPDALIATWGDGSLARARWIAAGGVVGLNAMVHCFDRFVMNKDYAQTTLRSMGHNLTHHWAWDNDNFPNNNFAHPYHGNLYFNIARSNGLSFWQSTPYALGGSLMWELFGEVDPPAPNDLMATTMGGICIGEVMHRVSNIILNDRTRGFNRFLREAGATLVNPMRGLNRIISGDAWRVRSANYLYHDHKAFPLDLAISVGNRYLADDGSFFRGEHNPYVNFYLEYGDPLNEDGHGKPFDFFDAEVTFGLSSNQPIINGIHLLGRLWSTPMLEGDGLKAEFGVYQHFNYYDSEPVKDGTSLTPYRISEAGSVGPGIVFSMPQVASLTRLEQRLFLSAIFIGGTKSDYYNVLERDYNMGSGMSVKSKTHLELRNFGRFILHAQYYQLYTWKGYEQKDLSTINLLHLNAQGDKGNARLLVLNPIVEFDVGKHLSVVSAASYFSRQTHYKYYDDVVARTFELRLGLVWHP